MVLVLAHLAGDFVLLPASWKEKLKGNQIRTTVFWYHLGVHAVLSLFTAIWIGWWALLVAPVVAILHGSIQWGVQRLLSSRPLYAMVVTQLLHLLSLWMVWSVAAGFEVQVDFLQKFSTEKGLLLLMAYLVVWYPLSSFMQVATQRWQQQVPDQGLPDAGKWIGRIERFLILTFILIDQFQAIGYLIAAKSVFRFGDLQDPKNHQRTEYILIGTLLSVSMTLLLGLGVRTLLGMM